MGNKIVGRSEQRLGAYAITVISIIFFLRTLHSDRSRGDFSRALTGHHANHLLLECNFAALGGLNRSQASISKTSCSRRWAVSVAHIAPRHFPITRTMLAAPYIFFLNAPFRKHLRAFIGRSQPTTLIHLVLECSQTARIAERRPPFQILFIPGLFSGDFLSGSQATTLITLSLIHI